MAAVEQLGKCSLVVRLLARAVSIAENAGRVVRNTVGKDLKIVQKGHNDLQTIADRSAQLSIVASFREAFGDDLCVIGEEEVVEPSDGALPPEWIERRFDKSVIEQDAKLPRTLKHVDIADLVVWVDPLDGTSEFAEGILVNATILIGVALKNRPIAGVIHQPFCEWSQSGYVGRTVYGLEGVGAFGIDIHFLRNRRIVVTTRSHGNELVSKTLEAMKPDEVLREGGSGYKVLMLLEGRANAYVFASRGCKKWDTCAPEAILRAAGGLLTDMQGCRMNYDREVERENRGGVLATCSEEDHRWYLDRVPTGVKDALGM